MVGWQLRLTPKQAAAKIVIAIVGLAIGAYGVATVYKPLQDELDLRKSELLRYYKTKHDERIRQAVNKSN
uniref:YtxH domain-containing protein n=1 Tax=Loa loa TaxID=7209 RepID=A0A1I7W3D8_LOALO